MKNARSRGYHVTLQHAIIFIAKLLIDISRLVPGTFCGGRTGGITLKKVYYIRPLRYLYKWTEIHHI